VDYTKRAATQDQLLTKIVQDVANSEGRLEWASPAPAVAIQPVTPEGIETLPASPTRAAQSD
jgi:hypothetical protein